MEKKVGNFSNNELALITQMLDSGATIAQIAQALNRSLPSVKNRIAQLQQDTKEEMVQDLRKSLHKKDYWPQLQTCFMTKDEELFFENTWVNLMDQFSREDVLHSDEMMIRELVLQEIDALRIRSQITFANRDRMRCTKELDDVLKKNPNHRDEEVARTILNLQQQISLCDQTITNLTKQLADAKRDKDKTFKSLKSTREQRIQNLREENKDLFFILRNLTKLEERVEQGRMNEYMNMASEKVKKQWGETTSYMDGSISKPLLNSETVDQ